MKTKSWVRIWFIVIIIILFVGSLFRYYGEYNLFNLERIIIETKKKWVNTQSFSEFDYIIIGSSKTLAINPKIIEDNIGLKGINLSMGGCNIICEYYTLKNIIKNNIKVPKLYINIIPEQLSKYSIYSYRKYGQKYLRYYFNENEAKEINNYLPNFYDFYTEVNKINYRINSDSFYIKSMLIEFEYLIKYGKTASKLLYSELNKTKGFYLFSEPVFSDKVNTEFNSNNYININHKLNENLPEVSELYFNKLLELLKNNSIDYKFFFSPFQVHMAEYSNLSFSKSMKLFGSLDNKLIKHVLLQDKQYFVDESHLNYSGSLVYNDWFINRVLVNNGNKTYKEYLLK